MSKKTFTDRIDRLVQAAEVKLSNPATRQQARDLLSLAKTRVQRERNRIVYATAMLRHTARAIRRVEDLLKVKRSRQRISRARVGA